jgi:hypothetical protein
MSTLTIAERRNAALAKCNEVCHREYDKYLKATEAARREYFDTLERIDREADEAMRAVKP